MLARPCRSGRVGGPRPRYWNAPRESTPDAGVNLVAAAADTGSQTPIATSRQGGRMRSRLAVLALLVPVLLGVIYWQWRHPIDGAAVAEPAGSKPPPPEPDRYLDLSGGADQEALAATLAAAYRLPVDRRMVAAVSDIRALVGGAAPSRVDVAWAGTR